MTILKNEDECLLLTDLYSREGLVSKDIRTKILINRTNPYHSYGVLYPSDLEYKKINLWEMRLEGYLKDLRKRDGSIFLKYQGT